MKFIRCRMGLHAWSVWLPPLIWHSRKCSRCGEVESGKHDFHKTYSNGLCGPGGELSRTITETCCYGESYSYDDISTW